MITAQARQHYRKEYFDHSGPDVWPKMSGYNAWDRFIFRRPEIAYQIAVDAMNETREVDQEEKGTKIAVRVCRQIQRLTGQRKESQVAKFTHNINYLDKTEDVRDFLEKLRSVLSRHLPDYPLPTSKIFLRFTDPELQNYKLFSWSEDWL